MRYTLLATLLTFLSLLNSYGQNNTIFNGGSGDGFSSATYLQNVVNLNNSIFNGGTSDGFTVATFLQPPYTLNNSIFNGGGSDGFNLATLGGVGSEVPLPVELISFDGVYKNGLVNLHWQTASEINNDYFQIERMIGASFEPIGWIQGMGTSVTSTDYYFTDSIPTLGIKYYRLLQVDFSGVSQYSKIIKVEMESDYAEILLYPNPTATGDFYLSIQNELFNDILVSIISENGLLVKEIIIPMNKTLGRFYVSASLDDGFYFVIIKSGLNYSTQWLLVIK